MAPDLNSMPPSPRTSLNNDRASTPRGPSRQNSSGPGGAISNSQNATSSSASTSRRASQIYPMSPPPLPLAQPTPSHSQQPFPPLSPLITSSSSGLGGVSSAEGIGVPMRHPRPLTAAELHLELEKEQEAVVNRLTRELTALRAHSVSVASTTSSTSTAPIPLDPQSQSQSQHHTPGRQNRSNSTVSRGSFSHGIPLSSATAAIPHYHRQSLSGHAETHAGPGLSRTLSAASAMSAARYEEAAQARTELEEAKRENEVLRQRVRELEGLLRRGRRGSATDGGAAARETVRRAEQGEDAAASGTVTN